MDPAELFFISQDVAGADLACSALTGITASKCLSLPELWEEQWIKQVDQGDPDHFGTAPKYRCV